MRWITLAAAALAMFLLGSIYAYGVMLPAIVAAFDATRAAAAFPHAVLLFTYAVGMGIGGILQDRVRATYIAISGGLLFGLGVMWASTAQTTGELAMRYGLLGGIGFGFAYVAAVTAVMQSFPDRRGFAAGVVVGAFGLGLFVWAPLAEHYLVMLGWSGIFTRFGALMLIALPLLGLGIRAPARPANITHPQAGVPGTTLGQAVRTPLFLTIFLAYTLVTSVGLLLSTHLVTYGRSQGMTALQAPLLLSVFAVGSALGRFFMGTWSDRVGRFPVIIGATLVEVVVLLLLMRLHAPTAIFILAVLIGFVYGTWLTLYGPIATDLFGLRAAGAIYGILYLSYGFGGLIGPWVGGVLADLTGGYAAAFLVCAAACLLAAGVFYLASRLHLPHYTHPPVFEEEFPVD